MRSIWQLAMTCAVLATISGCQGKKTAEMQQLEDQAAMNRVDAALQITAPKDRDEALATASRAAANSGAGDAAIKGIALISNPDLRDQVAEDSALKLRDASKSAAANRAATLITSQPKRDGVLKKLATSP